MAAPMPCSACRSAGAQWATDSVHQSFRPGRAIFGNEDGPPVKSGLPSKAEGPASENYCIKDDLAAAFGRLGQLRGTQARARPPGPCPAAPCTLYETTTPLRVPKAPARSALGSGWQRGAHWGEKDSLYGTDGLGNSTVRGPRTCAAFQWGHVLGGTHTGAFSSPRLAGARLLPQRNRSF